MNTSGGSGGGEGDGYVRKGLQLGVLFYLQRDGPITGRNRGLQVGELISGSLAY